MKAKSSKKKSNWIIYQGANIIIDMKAYSDCAKNTHYYYTDKLTFIQKMCLPVYHQLLSLAPTPREDWSCHFVQFSHSW